MMGCISESGTLPLPGHMRGPSPLEVVMKKRGCTCKWMGGCAAIVEFAGGCPVLHEHRGTEGVLTWENAEVRAMGAIFQ